MNNIEIQALKTDTLKLYGEEKANEIDVMNSIQLDALKRQIHNLKQKIYPSHKELREKRRESPRHPGLDFQKKPLHEDKIKEVEEKPEVVQTEKKDEKLTPIRIGKPSVLMIADVREWAWWIKSQYIKKYLSDEFDIHVINVLGSGASHEYRNKKDYDIYLTFGYSFVNYLNGVPMNKRVTGVTAHRIKNVVIGMMRKAKHIHANSILLKNDLERWGLKNVYYLPNGVDDDLFKPKVPIPVNKNNITVGHVGKKSNNKAQEEFILPAMNISKAIQFLHFNDFTNSIPHTEMPDIYQKFDVYICASREDGTPNPALESASCGRPILSNRIGNMPEFVKDGYNGFLVNRNVNEYVQKIKWFKENPDKMIEMGVNARETVLKYWTWERMSENYRNMFREIIKNK